MESKGKIKTISNEIVVSEKFKKREIVITTDETYPQQLVFQAAQDKCDLLNGLEVGQEITIHFNLRGKA